MSEDYLRRQSIWKLQVTPLNRRRLDNFKKNRRGFWSLWIFLILFALSLFAELIANDKPYLIWYKGEFFFPAIFEYPETVFGGDFPTEADYTDVFVQELIEKDGKKYKQFYGMSSDTAMERYYGDIKNYRASEGETIALEYKGPIDKTIQQILGGLRSAATYVGAKDIKDLPKCTTFILKYR